MPRLRRSTRAHFSDLPRPQYLTAEMLQAIYAPLHAEKYCAGEEDWQVYPMSESPEYLTLNMGLDTEDDWWRNRDWEQTPPSTHSSIPEQVIGDDTSDTLVDTLDEEDSQPPYECPETFVDALVDTLDEEDSQPPQQPAVDGGGGGSAWPRTFVPDASITILSSDEDDDHEDDNDDSSDGTGSSSSSKLASESSFVEGSTSASSLTAVLAHPDDID